MRIIPQKSKIGKQDRNSSIKPFHDRWRARDRERQALKNFHIVGRRFTQLIARVEKSGNLLLADRLISCKREFQRAALGGAYEPRG
jgi:hypothetical protein